MNRSRRYDAFLSVKTAKPVRSAHAGFSGGLYLNKFDGGCGGAQPDALELQFDVARRYAGGIARREGRVNLETLTLNLDKSSGLGRDPSELSVQNVCGSIRCELRVF